LSTKEEGKRNGSILRGARMGDRGKKRGGERKKKRFLYPTIGDAHLPWESAKKGKHD